jgi:hypothetical protein
MGGRGHGLTQFLELIGNHGGGERQVFAVPLDLGLALLT